MTANGFIKATIIGKCIFSTISKNTSKKIELPNVLHFRTSLCNLGPIKNLLFAAAMSGKNGRIYRNDGYEFFKLDKTMMV